MTLYTDQVLADVADAYLRCCGPSVIDYLAAAAKTAEQKGDCEATFKWQAIAARVQAICQARQASRSAA